MTGVPVGQLPAAVRKRLAEQGHDIPAPGRRRPAPSRAGTGDAQPCAGACLCGHRFETFAAWLRHCDTTDEAGHSRFDIDLDQETP